MKLDRVVLAIGILLLCGYAVFLRKHLALAVGGPDTGGYFNEAKLIASGHIGRPVVLAREMHLDDSWLGYFMPLGFAPAPHATMHPTYPPGLPMHVAAVATIAGWGHAPYYIAPLAAIGCAILMFAIARRLELSSLSSLAAASTLVLGPAFLWHATQPASDVLTTFWTLLAMFCALRAVERPAFAMVAGVAFAISVWVRPTNVLLVFALALAMRLRIRPLLYAAIAASPLAVALMVWNHALYGSAFRTGYGSIELSWQGVREAGPQYVRWLAEMLSPLAFPGGLLVIADRSIDRFTRWMLIAWFVPYLIFYCFYGFFDGWICIRFVLPAVPALIFGALLLIQRLEATRRTVWIAAILVLCIAAAPVVSTINLDVVRWLKTTEAGYPQYIKWAEKHLPKRAIVITGVLSGAFLYYANRPIVRFDQLDDDHFQILRAYAANAHLPWYAVLPTQELDYDALQKRFAGHWTVIDEFAGARVYRLD